MRPFLVFFRAFKKVKDAAFGSVRYDDNCPAYIAEVLQAAKNLEQFNINLIPKWHMLLHVPGFCESVGGPLGRYSDQAVEQVHQLYERIWDRFKVNDTEHDGFKAKQLMSVLTYNYDQIYRLVVDKKRRGQKRGRRQREE